MRLQNILGNRRSVLAGLLVVFLAPGTALAQSIDRIWHWNVGPTVAGLSMSYNDNGQPSHVWFDLGTNPDLSGARWVGEQRDISYGRAQSHATLSGLMPNTVYYYRATISTPYGKASSFIQSFRTALADRPAQKPSIRYEKMNLYESQGRQAMMFDFVGDGHGLSGSMYMLWSTDPKLARASRLDGGGLPAGPTGAYMHPLIYADNPDLPDGTTIYFQGVVETSSGRATTSILSVRFKKPNKDY